MASAPAFTATVNVGSGIAPATNDTSLTAPTNVTTVFTAGASGSRIEEIRIYGLGTTVAGRLNIFRFDGATYHLIDQVMVTAVTPSASQEVFFQVNDYTNLMLKNGDTLRISVMEASNVSLLKVTATGGDF